MFSYCHTAAAAAAAAAPSPGQRRSRATAMASAALLGAAAAAAAAAVATTSSPPAECSSSNSSITTSPHLIQQLFSMRLDDVERALAQGADPNTRHVGGWTPLMQAAVQGHVDKVELLLKQPSLDINAVDEYPPDPAVLAAQLQPGGGGGSTAAVRRHLNALHTIRLNEFSSLINPRAQTRGFTALHYAAVAGHTEVVRLLIQHQADPNITPELGEKAIEYTQEPEIRQLLQPYMLQHAEQRQNEARRRRKLFPLEQRLKQHIVGQDGAINAVASAIRRKENGWHDDEHPLVFFFLGSSGVGKTELAKRVADYIHDSASASSSPSSSPPKSFSPLGGSAAGTASSSSAAGTTTPASKRHFIRIDMTEYQTKHEVAKLIGSPPGYIGHDDGGQLTAALTAKPDAVVLFDEVEKAHPEVCDILLALFDEGRLTDSKGNTVDCPNAIFIMTSNLASDEIAHHGLELRRAAELCGTAEAEKQVEVSRDFKDHVVRPLLRQHFKNEFLGRVSSFCFFLPFSNSELRQLVAKELEKWKSRAKTRHKIDITWDDAVLDIICQDYEIYYGARSLQHAVNQRIVNRLATVHEQEKVAEGGHIHITTAVADADADDAEQASSSSPVAPKTRIVLDIKRKSGDAGGAGGGGGFFGWGKSKSN